MTMLFRHASVMPDEVLRFLMPVPGGVYVDGTLGGGGHTRLILESSGPDGRVIGFDRDADAQAAARASLAEFGSRVTFVQRNVAELSEVLSDLKIGPVDGLLLDLGVSSFQLDTPSRGFSFSNDAPLDMRMDRSTHLTAADLVNSLPEHELERIIREYGDERWARRIAGRIVSLRSSEQIKTTGQLADIVSRAIPRKFHEERIHPATRTFQALRISVNDELASIEGCLSGSLAHLKAGARIVVISFHSLEDRIVKHFFRDRASGCRCPKDFPLCVCGQQPELRIVTGRAVRPGDDEVAMNPRARSARLRAAEKC